MKSSIRKVLWICGILVLLAALPVMCWVRKFHHYTPMEALHNLQAAARVGPAAQPIERFMRFRYGPMANPANRQQAFLDFFNIGHIKGLTILVSHDDPAHRQPNIDAMAKWVAD